MPKWIGNAVKPSQANRRVENLLFRNKLQVLLQWVIVFANGFQCMAVKPPRSVCCNHSRHKTHLNVKGENSKLVNCLSISEVRDGSRCSSGLCSFLPFFFTFEGRYRYLENYACQAELVFPINVTVSRDF